jgi:hypothetical protein
VLWLLGLAVPVGCVVVHRERDYATR